MEQGDFQTLLNFFKVLGNDTRLRIIGLLANQERTVGEIAASLGLREPTVSEHLAKLKELDLVTVRPEGNFRLYSFNPKPLYMLNRDLFTREKLASLVESAPIDADAKILRTFVKDGRIAQMPTTQKKWAIMLKWLADQFEEGRQYTEKEINTILKGYNEDTATLRRYLVDFRFMARDKGVYWRTPEAVRESVEID